MKGVVLLRSELYHPLLIHFPIVLLILSFIFRILSIRLEKFPPFDLARLFLFTGTAFLGLSLFTGDIALEVIQTRGHTLIPVYSHENYAYQCFYFFLVTCFFDFILIFNHQHKRIGSILIKILFISCYVCALYQLIMASHSGAQLVYDFGIGVLPEK